MSLLEWARKQPIYEPWRRWRGRRQVQAVTTVLDANHSLGTAYSLEGTARSLGRIRTNRRVIAERPRVVAFGTRDWEDRGLWQAFERAGDFTLFDYGKLLRRSSSEAEERQRLGALFCDFLQQQRQPVDIVFAYAAGCYLAPAVFEAARAASAWTVVMSLDDKQQLPGPPRGGLVGWQLEAARAADLYWTTWRTGADWLTGSGVTAWYAPPGADGELFRPVPAEPGCDVLWVGRAYGLRGALVRWLRERGFSVRANGPGWEGGPLPFEEMVRSYSSARVVLGMGGVGQTDDFKHLKGRDFEVPMAGAVYLTSYNPELTDHFVLGKEILCYGSFVECADTLHWILRRPEVADGIRRAARTRCLAEHTWDRRIASLLELLRRP